MTRIVFTTLALALMVASPATGQRRDTYDSKGGFLTLAGFNAFEQFSETNRHKYSIITMQVLNETTKGMFPLPGTKESFDAMFIEIEYRYRYWALKEIETGPFGRSPDVPPPPGPTGAN